MPLRTGWYIKNHVIINQYTGDVTVEEFLQMAHHPDIVDGMDASAVPLVHFIQEATPQLTGIPGFQKTWNTPPSRHPKLGWSVFVSTGKINPTWKMIVSLGSQLVRARFRFVETHQEALDFLVYVDTTPIVFPPAEEIDWFLHIHWNDAEIPSV